MLDLFEMTRPLNGLMAMIGVLIGGMIAVGGDVGTLYGLPLLIAFVVVFLINGAGNVFNDYLDVDADKMNKPSRPLASGSVSRKTALVFSIALFVAGNALALTINGLCFTIAVFNSFVLIVYSLSLQHKLFLGNLAIGYLVGSVFLFGGAVFLNMRIVLILSILAMLSTITREIVKDLEDMEGDRKSFLKRMSSKVSEAVAPIAERFGVTTKGAKMRTDEKNMIVLAVTCILLAILFSFLPLYYSIMKAGYLAVVTVADAIFLWSAYSLTGGRGDGKIDYKKISKRLKIGMFVALLAFLVGIFV